MIREGIRFRPPRVEVPIELDWLLARALGAADLRLEWTEELDDSRVLDVGEIAGLVARIRARTPRALLEKELKPETLEVVDRHFHGAVASMMSFEGICRELADLAEARGHPMMVLKGVALHLKGDVAPGSRPAGDIDVLIPQEAARGFHQALIAQGYTSTGFPAPDYHLPLIHHPRGSSVEVHHRLAGVLLGDKAVTALGDLLKANLYEPVPDMPAICVVPSDELLLAHVLAHALGIHGRTPELYPSLRILADLQDLLSSPEGGRRVPAEVLEWIGLEVSREEVEAALEILARLESGARASSLVESDDDPGVLLRHLLAGNIDDEYARSLRVVRRLEAPASGSWLLKLLKSTWRAIWLTPQQIDVVYGKPAWPIGYFARRAWRPFELTGKSLKALQVHWKVRDRG